MTQPIQIYYWPTPNGRKVTIACEEMALPYALHFVDIGKGDQFKPEFLAISPNNRMPAIIDPDGPGGAPISVFESAAILTYLGRKTGKLYPTDERARTEVDEWVAWQVANLGPACGQANHFRNYAPGFLKDTRHTAYGAARFTNEVERLYCVMNERLEGRDFLCGDYSIADIICWPWVIPNAFGQNLAEFPNLMAWQERIAARPQVQKGKSISAPKSDANLRGTEDEQAKARAILFGQRRRS